MIIIIQPLAKIRKLIMTAQRLIFLEIILISPHNKLTSVQSQLTNNLLSWEKKSRSSVPTSVIL